MKQTFQALQEQYSNLIATNPDYTQTQLVKLLTDSMVQTLETEKSGDLIIVPPNCPIVRRRCTDIAKIYVLAKLEQSDEDGDDGEYADDFDEDDDDHFDAGSSGIEEDFLATAMDRLQHYQEQLVSNITSVRDDLLWIVSRQEEDRYRPSKYSTPFIYMLREVLGRKSNFCCFELENKDFKSLSQSEFECYCILMDAVEEFEGLELISTKGMSKKDLAHLLRELNLNGRVKIGQFKPVTGLQDLIEIASVVPASEIADLPHTEFIYKTQDSRNKIYFRLRVATNDFHEKEYHTISLEVKFSLNACKPSRVVTDFGDIGTHKNLIKTLPDYLNALSQ